MVVEVLITFGLKSRFRFFLLFFFPLDNARGLREFRLNLRDTVRKISLSCDMYIKCLFRKRRLPCTKAMGHPTDASNQTKNIRLNTMPDCQSTRSTQGAT